MSTEDAGRVSRNTYEALKQERDQLQQAADAYKARVTALQSSLNVAERDLHDTQRTALACTDALRRVNAELDVAKANLRIADEKCAQLTQQLQESKATQQVAPASSAPVSSTPGIFERNHGSLGLITAVEELLAAQQSQVRDALLLLSKLREQTTALLRSSDAMLNERADALNALDTARNTLINVTKKLRAENDEDKDNES